MVNRLEDFTRINPNIVPAAPIASLLYVFSKLHRKFGITRVKSLFATTDQFFTLVLLPHHCI